MWAPCGNAIACGIDTDNIGTLAQTMGMDMSIIVSKLYGNFVKIMKDLFFGTLV